MSATDAELVTRVLDGQVEVFAVLVDRYYDRYARFAVRMVGNREDAEEALQDTFLRAYRSLPHYRESDRFGAWLFRILVNQCRTVAARQRRHATVFPGLELQDWDVGEEPAGSGLRMDERDELREELHRALALLQPALREALLLKYGEELSYEEMAAITGSRVSALKMRVQRACAQLRQLLSEVHRVG